MSEKMQFLPKKDLLTLEELDKVCSVFIEMGIKKIRITGGEPLIRKDIMSFLESGTNYEQSNIKANHYAGINSTRTT